jgi:nicotinamidase-related amidase
MNTPSLLLTIDFINDIVHAEGRIPSCAPMVQARNVIAQTNRAIAWARRHGVPIAHVKVGFPKGYPNVWGKSNIFGAAPSMNALQLDTWGTAFHDDLDVEYGDFVFVKPRVSVFHNTPLESVLRARGIERIFLCGVSTVMAVELAVREAHDRDYLTTVLADCCAAATEQQHEAALAGAVARLSEVISVDDLPAQP